MVAIVRRKNVVSMLSSDVINFRIYLVGRFKKLKINFKDKDMRFLVRCLFIAKYYNIRKLNRIIICHDRK